MRDRHVWVMGAPLTVSGATADETTSRRHAFGGDERLARRVARGDEHAFTAIYQRYHQSLYRYCHSLLRNDADAQDALQATFTAAFTALRRSRRDAPLRPWLYRIAHNESISIVRRRRSHAALSDELAGAGESAEQQAVDRERLSVLVADLQELPERQRAALLMRELSGLSHEDIAIALETSEGAARQTVFEARRSLLEFEEGRAMDCDEVCRVVSDGDGRALRGRRVRAHLRACAGCSAFAEAIPARRRELNALAPALAPAAAGGLLAGVLGRAGAGHGGGAGAAAGAAGKSAALALAGKAVVGAAIVAGAGAGLSTALSHTHHRHAAAAAVGRSDTRAAGTAGGVSGHTSALHAKTYGQTRIAHDRHAAGPGAGGAALAGRSASHPLGVGGGSSTGAGNGRARGHQREAGQGGVRTRTRAHGPSGSKIHESESSQPPAHKPHPPKTAPAQSEPGTGADVEAPAGAGRATGKSATEKP